MSLVHRIHGNEQHFDSACLGLHRHKNRDLISLIGFFQRPGWGWGVLHALVNFPFACVVAKHTRDASSVKQALQPKRCKSALEHQVWFALQSEKSIVRVDFQSGPRWEQRLNSGSLLTNK